MEYKEILKREYQNRVTSNPRYSMRAFARDLGLFPSHLSQILLGRRGLSTQKANEMVKILALPEDEQQLFSESVTSQHARSRLSRDAARTRLLKYQKIDYQPLSADYFAMISDWYHFAVLELLEVKGARAEVPWISANLGVEQRSIEAAIERLLRVGLLSGTLEKFQLEKSAEFLATPSGVPSEAIRHFHKQILELAMKAIAQQSIDRRDFSAVTMSVERRSIPEIKERLKKFRREINQEYSHESADRDALYCLSIQFFDLMVGGTTP